MATRKRKRSAAPSRRITRTTVKRRTPMKRKRRTLSAGNIPLIGSMSIHNPLIGGAVGGFLASLIKDEIQDTIFGENPVADSWQDKIQPYAKGLVIAAAGFLARQYKQPEVAAGLIGAAAGYTRDKMKSAGILSANGNFTDGNLLSSASMLSDATMLSRYY